MPKINRREIMKCAAAAAILGPTSMVLAAPKPALKPKEHQTITVEPIEGNLDFTSMTFYNHGALAMGSTIHMERKYDNGEWLQGRCLVIDVRVEDID